MFSRHPSEDISAIIQETRSEVRDPFDVDSLFFEKLLPKPEHIEVQILADRHGDVIHPLGRDCTIQRRYQRIIEAAPAISVSTTI
jgi:pyruvate carboxylase